MSKHIITFILLLSSMTAWSQGSELASICHVILAMDGRSQMQINGQVWQSDIQLIRASLPSLLQRNGISSGIVSTLTYSQPAGDNNISHYTHTVDVAKPFDLDSIVSAWNRLSQIEPVGLRYSLLSLAKPYSLKALKVEPDETDAQLAYRTFLVLITDLKYNGNDDFYDELRHNPAIGPELMGRILDEVKAVQQNYFYDFKGQVPLTLGYMMLFECIPQQKYFALESVADYPHTVTAKRTKNGYVTDISFSSYNNPNYRLMLTELVIENSRDTLHGFGNTSLNIPQNSWNGTDSAQIQVKSWVRLIDGIYNRTVLSPDGSELQGEKGLNRIIVVVKEPTAKILWVLPLPGWLFKISFWTANQNVAASVWSVLIILALIVWILYKIGQTMKYKKPQQGKGPVFNG